MSKRKRPQLPQKDKKGENYGLENYLWKDRNREK